MAKDGVLIQVVPQDSVTPETKASTSMAVFQNEESGRIAINPGARFIFFRRNLHSFPRDLTWRGSLAQDMTT